jgi:hypothetical protein
VRAFALALVACLIWPAPAAAATIYVDALHGDDANDARSERPSSPGNGPVRTIARALERAGYGDTISLANHGIPYYEPISLTGRRHSGFLSIPFVLEGNGAIVDGSSPVPPRAWKRADGDLWKMTPRRKGHYVLLVGDEPLPEFRVPGAAAQLPAIPVGQWAAWRGSIYYHLPRYEEPSYLPLRLARWGVGLTLYDVRNVVVRNVTFRHFRLDGVNAHDRCRNVVLEDVRCVGNGRAGVAAAGTSDVTLRSCQVMGNLRHSVLITERAAAILDPEVPNELDEPPTLSE